MTGVHHPFSVFPEKVWPFIGQKLGDSAEILKLIQTIPEIEGAMNAKKRYWLFDQIIPHLSKFLKVEDKLACRQVCSQWSQAVDNFIESHPMFRAYQHGSQNTGQIWTTNEGRPTDIYETDFIPLSSFYSQDHITNFLEKMGTPLERWRNPFMHRALLITSALDTEVLPGMQKIVEPFGQHISNILIYVHQHREAELLCNSLREWLAHLPNLKGLRIYMLPAPENVQNAGDPEADYLQRWKEPLPPLPHLGSLQIASDIIPSPVINALVTSYSQQIRGLMLPIDEWKSEFHAAFPNITELFVDRISPNFDLNSLLLSIQTPLLYKLELDFGEGCRLEMGTDIFPWLRRFPLLRNVGFRGNAIVIGVEDDLLSPATCSIPSVKYLWIGTQYLFANSDFLLCFPNLEYIHLELAEQPPEGLPLEPVLKIWQPLIQGWMYEDSNVWELLPKLKGICVTPHGDDEQERRFKRETYYYRQKLLAQA